MSGLRILYAMACILIAASTSGCRDKIKSGHYEGNFLKKKSNKYTIEPVHLDVSYQRTNAAKIEVKDRSKSVIATAFVSHPKRHQILLSVSGIQEGTYILTRIPVKNQLDKYKCYAAAGGLNVNLCFSKSQFYLRFLDPDLQPLLTLSGNKFKLEPKFDLETPKEIALSSALDEAFKTNYDSRIALEHVFQAKNSATAAWLNLLPHLTTNLIWHAPSPNYISIIATLQGLTPFLLPTWWMDARVADINTKIQKDALTIVQADLASNIEQLFYAYERDAKINVAHENIANILDDFELKVLLNKQILPSNNSTQALLDLKKELLDLVQSTQSGIERVLKEDRYAISLALGKHNPDAVSNISIGQEYPPIDQAKPIDQEILGDWASQRSFEIDQIDYLIQIAQIKKVELFFTWLDPSGDQRSSFGFNLIGQVRVAKSQIEELKIKREQLKSIIYKNCYVVALDYNGALNTFKKVQKPKDLDSKLQELSVKLEDVLNSGKLEAEPLKGIIQTTLAEIVQYESNLAAFRIARAKKDRLMLNGYFEKLLPRLPSLDIPIDLQFNQNLAKKKAL